MSVTPLATTPADVATRGASRDTDTAIAILVAAFTTDPVVRWFLPNPTDYLTVFPAVLRLASDGATPAGTVDLADGDTGAAIWHRPGTATADEALAELIASQIPPPRHATVFRFLEQMDAHHPDPSTVWYLPFVGVDPTRQSEGHGSLLLQAGLQRADRDGLPAYLEASSPRNRALYERHGFEVTGEIQVADSPPMWPMHRRAR